MYDAIIVLGGGRHGEGKPTLGVKKGDLTALSTDRLDAGARLFQDLLPTNPNLIIFALGENKSTYAQTAIEFAEPGCALRKKYLLSNGVPNNAIVEVNGGRDTIGETFTIRAACRELGVKNVLLVTSKTHMERALWIFQKIFGEEIFVDQPEQKYSCEDKLNSEEEREIFELTKNYFHEKFGYNPVPNQNMQAWFEDNAQFYAAQSEIHARYMTGGVERNDAYLGSGKKESSE
jgi:uncharacterized SAM-binding protein YcdF (DUF218 family)